MATNGFENCGVPTTPEERAVVAGWNVIDFAYDTDWTGLRNWTGSLPGSTFFVFSTLSRLFSSVPTFSFDFSSFFHAIHSDVRALVCTVTRYIRTCVHVTRTRGIRYTACAIFLREPKKGSLSRISRRECRRGLASNERFVRSSRMYL